MARLKWKKNNPNYKRNRDPEKIKLYKSSDPLYKRKEQIKKVYNLTWEQFQELHLIQNGKCNICIETIELTHKDTVVDHCHTTGNVRGLLCRKCNMALGLLSDSKENLARAINYLEKSNAISN